ncbi:MAG: hypothetical protein DHS20C02_03310 [Micavibrio sp.]|nr:MAG: hypothetical protein DHS20C02_03310 [Micavibrio sp.]
MKWLSLIIFLALPSLAMAAEPVTYSPDYCEFAITFPEKPYTAPRCEDGKEDRCYELVSYTQVFQLSSTVNFRIICNPSGEDLFEQYSGKVMESTLKSMTERSVVKTFDTSFREEENYKQAGLVGEGKVGVTPTIYIAQLWIGHNSILSVEAELIGEADEVADSLFSSVLKSVHFVTEEEKKAKEEAEGNKSEESDDKEE